MRLQHGLSSSSATLLFPAIGHGGARRQGLEVERDAMIIILDGYAYSYLVPSMPESVRVIGANNNIVRPEASGELQSQVAHAISEHRGPIWGVDDPRDFSGVADQTLSYYHLSRSDNCAFIEKNIEDRPNKIRMCHLVRH